MWTLFTCSNDVKMKYAAVKSAHGFLHGLRGNADIVERAFVASQVWRLEETYQDPIFLLLSNSN